MSCKRVFTYTKNLLFLLLLPGSLSLRNVELIIPEAVERGKSVVIRCMYDLENEELYQVKWYRGDREFFRYAPGEVPPLKTFPIPGIEVDLKGSDAKQITISAATSTAQGRYTCEVSADAPSFLTAQMHGFMYVVDLPKSYPDLIWIQQRYKPGMMIKAECISYDSMPPANLSFYINDELALSQHIWQRVSGSKNSSLMTAYSTLQFVLQKQHIISYKIRIRCTAAIYSVYYKSHEQVANAERIRTTSAPVYCTQETIVFPKNREISKKNCASWNRNTLWAVCFLPLIIFGQLNLQ